jgi:hypothetical protein
MTLNRFKHIALGLACYAAAMYLFKIANSKLDNALDEAFKVYE